MASRGSGGNDDVYRILGTIAVMALTWYVGGAVGAAGGPVAGGLFAGATSVLGMTALNSLFPGPRQGQGQYQGLGSSPTYSLTGARNEARPYAPIPRTFGRYRWYPSPAALPYTETVGDDQYLNLLLDLGYGPLRLEELRIGETLVGEFGDTIQWDFRPGEAGDAPLELFRSEVETAVPGILLEAGDYHVVTSGDAADELVVELQFDGLVTFDPLDGSRADRLVEIEVGVRPTGSSGEWDATYISPTDVTLASGATRTNDAGHQQTWRVEDVAAWGLNTITVDVTVPADRQVWIERRWYFPEGWKPWQAEQRVVARPGTTVTLRPVLFATMYEFRFTLEKQNASGAWVPAAGEDLPDPTGFEFYSPNEAGSVIRGFTDRRETLVRRTLRIKPGARGQYDVRLRRQTADTTDPLVRDKCTWSQLQTHRYADPVAAVRGKHALLAIHAKASDQLQGLLDQVNVVTQRLLPTYDGSSWTAPLPTSSPAWAYADPLRGPGLRTVVPDGRIDGPGLKAWAERCAAAGRELNAVVDYDVSRLRLLQDIATVGRASPTVTSDGRYSIVEDYARTEPQGALTPRNTWNWSSTKVFVPETHALRLRFRNQDKGWAPDERIVYADGYDADTAERYDEADVWGVTNGDQVWRDGRYRLALAKLRPEEHSTEVDFEHFVFQRGALLELAHDVLLIGLKQGRLKSVTGSPVTAVTVDEPVVMAAGKSYGLRLRRSDNTQVVQGVVTVAGEHASLTLTAGVSGIAAGDLFLFGEAGSESAQYLVAAVKPLPDLAARLTLVDAAPAVHTADQGEIPAWDSHITLPPAANRAMPLPPIVGTPQTESVRHSDGTYGADVLVPLTMAATPGVSVVEVQGQYRLVGSQSWTTVPSIPATSPVYRISGLAPGGVYEMRFRVASALGLASVWALVACTVASDIQPPARVTSVRIQYLDRQQALYIVWEPPTDKDLSHYRLLLTPPDAPPADADWDDTTKAIRVERPNATVLHPSARDLIAYIRAYDRTGNAGEIMAQRAYLKPPDPPNIGSLGDVLDHNRVVLLVADTEPRPPAWVGWQFQYRFNGGGWTTINEAPLPFVAFDLPLGLGQSGTYEWRYAGADIFGAGAWSDPTSGVTVSALGEVADQDLISTDYLVGQSATSSDSVSRSGDVELVAWSDGSSPTPSGAGTFLSVVILAPPPDATGVLVTLSATITSELGGLCRAHFWLIPEADVKAVGQVTTAEEGFLNDSNGDFGGIAVDDLVWFASDFSLDGIHLVSSIPSSIRLELNTGAHPQVGQGYLITGVGDPYPVSVPEASAPAFVQAAAGPQLLTFTTILPPWTGGDTRVIAVVGLMYDPTNPTATLVVSNPKVETITLKR